MLEKSISDVESGLILPIHEVFKWFDETERVSSLVYLKYNWWFTENKAIFRWIWFIYFFIGEKKDFDYKSHIGEVF